MTFFATELATPSVTDERTYGHLPSLIYKEEDNNDNACTE